MRYSSVVFDCDSTLVAVEGIDLLAGEARAEVEQERTARAVVELELAELRTGHGELRLELTLPAELERPGTEAAPGELTEIITAPASKRWPAGVLALVGMTALLAGVWYVGRQSAPASAADPVVGVSSASIASISMRMAVSLVRGRMPG